jgi:hypothetical protein
VLRTARRLFPFIERVLDAGYQGPKMAKVVADSGCWILQIVKRSDAPNFLGQKPDGQSTASSQLASSGGGNECYYFSANPARLIAPTLQPIRWRDVAPRIVRE